MKNKEELLKNQENEKKDKENKYINLMEGILKNKYADSSYFAACTLQTTKKYFLLSEARAPVHIHQISTGGSRGGDTAVQ